MKFTCGFSSLGVPGGPLLREVVGPSNGGIGDGIGDSIGADREPRRMAIGVVVFIGVVVANDIGEDR